MRSGRRRTNPEVTPPRTALFSHFAGRLGAARARRALSFLGPRSWVPAGPWVSTATAGALPRGGQPEWGRGAPRACAAVSPCSPLWPPCSLSRCPPRCPGETRVKYSQGRPSCPSPRVHTLLTRAGQCAPPSARLSPGSAFRNPPGSFSCQALGRLVVSSAGTHRPLRFPHHFSGPEFCFPFLFCARALRTVCVLCSRQKESTAAVNKDPGGYLVLVDTMTNH